MPLTCRLMVRQPLAMRTSQQQPRISTLRRCKLPSSAPLHLLLRTPLPKTRLRAAGLPPQQ